MASQSDHKLYKRLDFGNPFNFTQVKVNQNCNLVYKDNYLVDDEGSFMSM